MAKAYISGWINIKMKGGGKGKPGSGGETGGEEGEEGENPSFGGDDEEEIGSGGSGGGSSGGGSIPKPPSEPPPGVWPPPSQSHPVQKLPDSTKLEGGEIWPVKKGVRGKYIVYVDLPQFGPHYVVVKPGAKWEEEEDENEKDNGQEEMEQQPVK